MWKKKEKYGIFYMAINELNLLYFHGIGVLSKKYVGNSPHNK